MVDGSQHVDHQTRIEHVAPNCPSHELFKGILDGNSHGVFNGKVYVHPEAQKTDGKQSNNNLLLSDGARVDTKPQLEIFADDVKCTHGATVGRLDETALFYMRSRGIGPSQAKRLLTYAFAADVLEKIELEPLKEALEHFADRLALEESRAFATLINQSIDLGSSITDAMRVYSDDMRHKRLSAAEEKAYALPAKLAVPMMVCIFPVLFVVILLPVIVRLHMGGYF